MNLIKYFFSDKFIIDEKPLELYITEGKDKTIDSIKTDDQSEDPDTMQAFDFFSQISKLLIERERLQSKMNEIQSWSRSTDELHNFIKSVLPFLDSLEITLESARQFPVTEEIRNWLKSIESLYFRFYKTLENAGLQALKSIGRVVDLNFHDVVEYIPSNNYPNDTIIKERQKGYIFRGRLLRDAKVVVAYNERRVN